MVLLDYQIRITSIWDIQFMEDLTNKTEVSRNILKRIEISEEIDGLLELENNWDGYGASEIENDVSENTKYLIDILPNYIFDNLAEYDIYPNSNGTITLEFMSINSDLLVIEIGKECINGYIIKGNYEEHLIDYLKINENNFSTEIHNALNILNT